MTSHTSNTGSAVVGLEQGSTGRSCIALRTGGGDEASHARAAVALVATAGWARRQATRAAAPASLLASLQGHDLIPDEPT